MWRPGWCKKEVGERIAKASKVFGALRMPVFRDSNQSSLKIKRMVYRSVWSLVCCSMDQRHGLPG